MLKIKRKHTEFIINASAKLLIFSQSENVSVRFLVGAWGSF